MTKQKYLDTSPNTGYSDGNNDQAIQDEKQICVDVSTFLPIIWTVRDGEECNTEFVQKCEERSENVCGDVTETVCEVCNVFSKFFFFHKVILWDLKNVE